MKARLAMKALAFFLVGALFVALLLFLPAGTMAYPGAWRLMGLLFIPMMIMGVLLLLFAPEVLKKRLNAKEKMGDQKRVMTPAAAKEIGSDYIVVGRPITAAADPVAAYERCVAEFCD